MLVFMLPALVLLLVLMLLPARRFIRNLHNDKDAQKQRLEQSLGLFRVSVLSKLFDLRDF